MLLAAASPAQAETRAVFVGIDTYRFSAVQPEGAEFRDLKGAVNDAQRMRAALNEAYGFDFADPPREGCPADDPAARVVVLLNACATRQAILAAIAGQSGSARPGDTFILYLAGHGGRLLDMNSDRPGSQASGRNSTFLPYDARDPANAVQGDILDIELDDLIDKALARGVNVVTIADSCSSGTVTRANRRKRGKHPAGPVPIDVVSRAAPDLEGFRDVVRGFHGAPRGRAVSLAAALDTELSFERRYSADEPVGGAFTSALIAAIRQDREGTIADLMTAVRGDLLADERRPQHPQAEGETRARLGPAGLEFPVSDARLFDVQRAGGKLVLTSGGSFAGIARGTRLALFGSAREALDPAAAALASAEVGSVEPYSARLRLTRAPARALPEGALFAREEPGQMAGARAAQARDPRLARVDDLLTRPSGPPGTLAMCVAQEAFDPAECGTIGGVQSGGKVVLAPDAPAQVVLVNLIEQPLFLTLLAVGADNSIRVVVPRRGGHDVPLAQNTPLVQTIPLGAEGTTCRYLAIATDRPLDSAALAQDGTLPGLDPTACGGALERAASPRATGLADKGVNTKDPLLWAMIGADIVVSAKGETIQ